MGSWNYILVLPLSLGAHGCLAGLWSTSISLCMEVLPLPLAWWLVVSAAEMFYLLLYLVQQVVVVLAIRLSGERY